MLRNRFVFGQLGNKAVSDSAHRAMESFRYVSPLTFPRGTNNRRPSTDELVSFNQLDDLTAADPALSFSGSFFSLCH